MLKRLFTSAFILSFCLLLLLFSVVLPNIPIMPVGMGAFAACATFELLRCTHLAQRGLVAFPAYILSFILPIGAFFAKDMMDYIAIAFCALFAYMLYLFIVAIFSHNSHKSVIPADVTDAEGQKSTLSERGLFFRDVALAVTGLMYIAMSFTGLVLLRRYSIDGMSHHYGLYLFATVFFIAWMTDVFAFFTGTWFGKHKLIPEVSPKKSVEGAIGGIVGGVVGCVAYALFIQYTTAYTPNLIMFIIMGAIGSVVSQAGDLIASLIKREYGVKDYGQLLPGHGGILDRFDSIIAATTVVVAFSFLRGDLALITLA